MKRKISLTKNQRLFKPYLEAATSLCSDVIRIVSDYATPVVVIGNFVTTIDLLSEQLCWIDKTHFSTKMLWDNRTLFREMASGKICDGIPNNEEQTIYLDNVNIEGRSSIWQNGECFSYNWPWMHCSQKKTLSIHCDVNYQQFWCFADINVMISYKNFEFDVWRIEIV